MNKSIIISEKYKKNNCNHWYVKTQCICGKILEQRYKRAGGLCLKCKSKHHPPPIKKPKEDLTNKKFGTRLVTSQYYNKEYKQTFVDVLCDCGYRYSSRKYVFKKCKYCPKCKNNSKSKEFRKEYCLNNGIKKCCMCKKCFKKNNFGIDKSRPDKLHRFCKNCSNLYIASKKYNLSIEELKNKYQQACEICGCETVCIDHCHKTLKVRGSLCKKCNLGLGAFNDNINYLNAAIKYLEKT